MKAKYLALWGAVLTAGALLAETADWRPAERWRGFNLLGMFRAPTIGLAPDPRVDGHFVEWEFKALHDWGFNFARLPLDYRILDAQTGTVLVTGHTQNVYTSRETGHIERLTDKYWSILKRAMEQEKKQGALSTSAAPQGKGEA